MNKILEKILVRDMNRVPDYVPGRSIEEVCRSYGLSPADVSKNASNENPLGPSELAVKAVRDAAASMHVYPESVNAALCARIAAICGVGEDAVVFGNGSDEVLDFIMKLFVAEGDEVVIPECTFQMYKLLADIYGAKSVFVPLRDFRLDLDSMLEKISGRTKIVFVCNPNNPTGDFYTHEDIVSFVARLPETVVAVIDEAYCEFAPGYGRDLSSRIIDAHPMSIVVRTFSKLYALAGLRVGYGIMHPDVAACMMRIKPPFNNSTVSQAAALAALGDSGHIEKSLRLVEEGREYLYRELDRIGCEYMYTGANFICIGLGREAKEASEELIRGGIIVRALGAFGMPDYIRYTIGLRKTNEKFVALLEKLLKRS